MCKEYEGLLHVLLVPSSVYLSQNENECLDVIMTPGTEV